MDRRSVERCEQLESGEMDIAGLVSRELIERITAAVRFSSAARLFTPVVTL